MVFWQESDFFKAHLAHWPSPVNVTSLSAAYNAVAARSERLRIRDFFMVLITVVDLTERSWSDGTIQSIIHLISNCKRLLEAPFWPERLQYRARWLKSGTDPTLWLPRKTRNLRRHNHFDIPFSKRFNQVCGRARISDDRVDGS